MENRKYIKNIFFRKNLTLLEAAVNGAGMAGKAVATVVVNFIAFFGALELVDTILEWFGGKVGYSALSYKVRSYLNIF